MARGKRETLDKAHVVESILQLMAEGKTVQDGVKVLALGVSAGTVRRWMAERDEWMTAYQRAKKLLAAAFAEEALQVARETTNHSSAADRVLIETLKWAAAKASPSEYGEKQTVEHQGAQTLQVKIVEDDVPIRNPKAAAQIGDAISSAISTPVILAIPARKPSKDED